ncbi:MAG: 2-amino-4-hydroxy-6-hydroxymethyldihydropteridine diphosphokinase [Elusimicrobiota bacterium]
MPIVYLGFGSNAGNRIGNIKKALRSVSRLRATKILGNSSYYLTSPVGPRQRDFVNSAAKVRTALPPGRLLPALKEIEKKLGRKKTVKWGPRSIDIDILFYGRKRVFSRKLVVPHGELRKRLFVLEPLVEIAPYLKHPETGKTAAAMLKLLRLTSPNQRIRIIK